MKVMEVKEYTVRNKVEALIAHEKNIKVVKATYNIKDRVFTLVLKNRLSGKKVYRRFFPDFFGTPNSFERETGICKVIFDDLTSIK